MKDHRRKKSRPVRKEKVVTRGSEKRNYYFLASVILLTVVLYAKSLGGNLLNWDDRTYIVFNESIHKLDWKHLREIFSTFYASNYHPLTSLSWAIEHSISGTRSFLYHFDNLILHLLNVVLVFSLFKKVSGKEMTGLIVAAFFAIHPMHVESVAWISERKDLMYTFFFLLSLISYTKYVAVTAEGMGKLPIKWLLASFCFFVLSLLSKSAAVILPVLLFLFDYLYRRRIDMKLFLEKLPFLLLSVLFGVLALKSQVKVISDLPEFSVLQKMLVVNYSFLRYMFMAILPVNLSAYHPWPQLEGGMLPSIYYFSPLITFALITAVVYSIRKTRTIAFGILFFTINLLLVIQFIPVGVAVIAERYSYVSYLGLFFIVAIFVVKEGSRVRPFKTASIVVMMIALCCYSYGTEKRIAVWNNDRALWDDMIGSYPNTAYVAYYNRAKFRHENKQDAAAIEDLSKLIEWKKYYSEALTMRGSIYDESGKISEAMKDFNEAINFDSTYYLAFNNRGSIRMKSNDLQGALNDFTKCIQLKGDYSQAYYNRGAAKLSLNDFAGGLEDMRESQRINPGYCRGYYGMANAYSSRGSFAEALDLFSKAIECDNRFADAYINRGNMKIQLNDLQGAIDDFSKVIELDPGYSYAWFNRGRLKVQLNSPDAEQDLRQCISLNPRFGDAYVALGNYEFTNGDKPGACEVWSRGAEAGSRICISNVAMYCR